jgi:cobyrinic acid a,c-diamide synthase
MKEEKRIPRVLVAGTKSNDGKTTFAIALAWLMRQKGLRVQCFKVGPDYIDTGYLSIASGRQAFNLDTWLLGKSSIIPFFEDMISHSNADIAIIEGVMGLFDGGRQGVSSTAEIAGLLHAPVILVIDCQSMGTSSAAVALGFQHFSSQLSIAGVALNRLGSVHHAQIVSDAMAQIHLPVFAKVCRDESLKCGRQHLGLHPISSDIKESRYKIDTIGKKLKEQINLSSIIRIAEEAPALPEIQKNYLSVTGSLQNAATIAVARDEAFSFYYPDSLAVLEHLGARVIFFSPLHDEHLPDADGLIFGGGFPELYAEKLSCNVFMRREIRLFVQSNRPVYSECGGYLYLSQSLQDLNGRKYPMCGVFSLNISMTSRLQEIGYVTAELVKENPLGTPGKKIRGHVFHYSKADEKAEEAPFLFHRLRDGSSFPAGMQNHQAVGSYLHVHFAGCPETAASFIKSCVKRKT